METKMAYQPISVIPERCHGCLTCQLRCSLRVTGRMNPARSHIRVDLSADGYSYRHSFSEECDGCGGIYLCVQWCPYGALELAVSKVLT